MLAFPLSGLTLTDVAELKAGFGPSTLHFKLPGEEVFTLYYNNKKEKIMQVFNYSWRARTERLK